MQNLFQFTHVYWFICHTLLCLWIFLSLAKVANFEWLNLLRRWILSFWLTEALLFRFHWLILLRLSLIIRTFFCKTDWICSDGRAFCHPLEHCQETVTEFAPIFGPFFGLWLTLLRRKGCYKAYFCRILVNLPIQLTEFCRPNWLNMLRRV